MRWSAAIGALAALAAAPAALGAQIVVTTGSDVVAPDGQCSLREAVSAARTNAPVGGCPAGAAGALDDILLDARTFALVIPGRSEGGNATGDLDPGTDPLRVSGVGPATVIDAAGVDRVFDLPAGGTLVLQDLTIRGGAPAPGGPGDGGGAVASAGSLTVRRVVFDGNAAGAGQDGPAEGDPGAQGGSGGAIRSAGPGSDLVVLDSLFTANRAGDGGNGAFGQVEAPGRGGTGGDGGAISVTSGTAAITRSAFLANRAGPGGRGGLDVANVPARAGGGAGGWAGAVDAGSGAMVTIVNSTFEGNRAGDAGAGGPGTSPGGTGGALFENPVSAQLTATHSTFAGNLRGAGGLGANGVAGFASVGASILADSAPACGGGFVPGPVVNLVPATDTSCGQGAATGPALLGPAAANGGPTPSILPGPGSAAIDLLPADAPCPATDQRGLPRPALGGCDAGAVEVQSASAGPGPGPGAGGPPSGAARLVGLSIAPATVRVGGRRPQVALATYRLDGAATVTFRVRRLLPGRRRGAACVPPRPALRGAARCLRRVGLRGSVVRAGTPGPNVLRLTGRFAGRLLPSGRYELVARVPGGAPRARGFRVQRRP